LLCAIETRLLCLVLNLHRSVCDAKMVPNSILKRKGSNISGGGNPIIVAN
jgi:hypothetical protein